MQFGVANAICLSFLLTHIKRHSYLFHVEMVLAALFINKAKFKKLLGAVT